MHQFHEFSLDVSSLIVTSAFVKKKRSKMRHLKKFVKPMVVKLRSKMSHWPNIPRRYASNIDLRFPADMDLEGCIFSVAHFLWGNKLIRNYSFLYKCFPKNYFLNGNHMFFSSWNKEKVVDKSCCPRNYNSFVPRNRTVVNTP